LTRLERHRELTVILGCVSVETSCVFCRIVIGSEPAHIVYEDPDSIALFPLAPAAEGHTLVVPRQHARTLIDIAPASAGALMIAASHVARMLDLALHPDGMTMFQTNERAGWQSVFHVHLHLVPRWKNDNLIEPWKVGQPDGSDLDALRLKIVSNGGV
jgi:histidine triad (HIT) family protein